MAILRATVNLMIQIFYLLEKIGQHRSDAGKQIIRNILDCDEYLSRE